MNGEMWLLAGLTGLMALVLLLPFFVKKIEEELEIFLLIMGVLAVSLTGLWSRALVREALMAPVKISLAVLLAGLLFRKFRQYLQKAVSVLAGKVGYGPVIFLTVFLLGLASSFITAIIAALALAEIVGVLELPRDFEIKLVVASCFSIGLGAVLTPLGEPLAAIASAKLQGTPHHAGFFFLLRLLGMWVIPAILGLAGWAAWLKIPKARRENRLRENRAEYFKDIAFRSLKTYIFVMALVLLGTGLTTGLETILLRVPPAALYWGNMISAVLDNATLTAAEITPKMSLGMIRYLLLGLLISGGMLIPGNIPNIICAGKLSIKSKEWARVGIPMGLTLMAVYFMLLALMER